jgi:hypothetical protein
MEEEPSKVGGSYPRYVKPKKKASGKSAKRPAEEDPGTEVPTDAAGGESTTQGRRLQLEESLRLVLRAKDLDERLCRTYGSLDDLLSYDFAAQWRPSATKLNADDQDEYY